MEIERITRTSDLDRVAEEWEILKLQADRFYPSFSEAREFLRATQKNFCVLAARDHGRIICLACFIHEAERQRFTVGERLLFSLPVRETWLYGSSFLGSADEATLRRMLMCAISEWQFDVFTLGEVNIDSKIHKALRKIGGGIHIVKQERKDSLHWFIDLPRSFQEYLDSLRTSTKRSVLYKIRRFEREVKFKLEVITTPEQVKRFLRDGERISRLTYQWTIGQQLRDDDLNRERYQRLASQGRLRCYMVYVDEQPCAFLRGEIGGSKYHYETPGFDPRFEKLSPGLVLLMWAVRDLIENTDCAVFDFGSGGDEQGYKSRFGNISVRCSSLQLIDIRKPYSLSIFLIQASLSRAKSAASFLIGQGALRQKLKKAIRKYG